MGLEAGIFIRLQHREKARIDIADAHRETPAPVTRREGTKQVSIAVEDDRRALLCDS
jgi:hypothetical protein